MKYPPVHYQAYLKLDQLLDSQKLRSVEFGKPAHDEMLFITVHQTYELWFKQMLFELDSVMETFSKTSVPDTQMGIAVARLERVVDIQKFINGQIDILETMTPLDFLEFRDFLYPASGFQSFQWRCLETKLGLTSEQRLNYNQEPFFKSLQPAEQSQMQTILQSSSLFELLENGSNALRFYKPKVLNSGSNTKRPCVNFWLRISKWWKKTPVWALKRKNEMPDSFK
jgi:tryptophan 2,3-dioxygenase